MSHDNDIKLNLGCGSKIKDGYVNVDKYGEPDIRFDLETVPWPWADSSVSEILLSHVLEHLGQETDVYLGILKELYRVCKNGAQITINVPHPRHDDFLGDPTHVRVVTPESLSLLSKEDNHKWVEDGAANTPLGIYLDVDFVISKLIYTPDPSWQNQLNDKSISEEDFMLAARKYNNVVKEYIIVLDVIK
jgi:hypothetical protein